MAIYTIDAYFMCDRMAILHDKIAILRDRMPILRDTMAILFYYHGMAVVGEHKKLLMYP